MSPKEAQTRTANSSKPSYANLLYFTDALRQWSRRQDALEAFRMAFFGGGPVPSALGSTAHTVLSVGSSHKSAK